MKAKIKTKSNYRNLNGQWLEVKEIVGTRVTCLVDTEYGKNKSIDFTLKEVVEMNSQDIYTEKDMRRMYDVSCGNIGMQALKDQTDNNNRFEKFLSVVKSGENYCHF